MMNLTNFIGVQAIPLVRRNATYHHNEFILVTQGNSYIGDRRHPKNSIINLYIIPKKEGEKKMKDTYLTVKEIAELLKISYDSALDVVKYSGVEYVQIGRQYRVLESKLHALLNPPQPKKKPLRSRPIYQIVERK